MKRCMETGLIYRDLAMVGKWSVFIQASCARRLIPSVLAEVADPFRGAFSRKVVSALELLPSEEADVVLKGHSWVL